MLYDIAIKKMIKAGIQINKARIYILRGYLQEEDCPDMGELQGLDIIKRFREYDIWDVELVDPIADA